MSDLHTMFFSYNFMGRKPVVVIKHKGIMFTLKTYKTALDMPPDLRHQYRCKRIDSHMSRLNKNKYK